MVGQDSLTLPESWQELYYTHITGKGLLAANAFGQQLVAQNTRKFDLCMITSCRSLALVFSNNYEIMFCLLLQVALCIIIQWTLEVRVQLTSEVK